MEPVRRFCAVVLVLSLGLLNGCGAKDIVEEIVNALDNAVYTLDQNSAEYQTILRDLMAKLENIDSEVSVVLRRDIQGLLERTPAVIGQEFRCNVDFVGARLRQGLQCAQRNFMLTNLYTGDSAIPECAPRRPAVCAVTPSTIDQQLGARTVDLYGYDFDIGVDARVLQHGGSTKVVTQYLSMPSHYHLALNLGDNGVSDIFQYDLLELLHQGSVVSSVAIVGGAVCSRINPGSRTVVLNEVSECTNKFYGYISGEDSDRVTVNTKLYISDDQKTLRSSIEVTPVTNQSRYRRTFDEFPVFTAQSGAIVSEAVVDSEESFSIHDDDSRVNYIERGNAGLVHQYELKVGNVNCFESNGYVKVTFNSFDVCTYRQ